MVASQANPMANAADPAPTSNEPLRSIHTDNFPDVLKHLGISLVVSTYQAGKLIVVRADGGALNTHFRLFQKPMGLAVNRERLAIGSGVQIWELRNVPAVAAKLTPLGKHDACYLPRTIHVTGDIDIHEMAWGNEGLWFVNTRFSCLCTLDFNHSFVPRWRPRFVSAYAPEDRCHLNGLEMVAGQPKYVTALGSTDDPGGWRRHKANGGLLIEVDSHEIVAQGLSMPHSPRWYRDQLWVLESGCGSLAKVDPKTGTWETVAQLPGFTRGLDFCGPLAFIGLSQVRETAVFSHLPITQQEHERTCGVWVVNIETGQLLAFLKFEDAVQEIFAVQVLHGIRFPEVISAESEHLSTAYVLPDEALAEVAFTPLANQALRWGDQRPDAPADVTSVAVVMPVQTLQDLQPDTQPDSSPDNGEGPLKHTLDSIDASWAYCQTHHPHADTLTFEVVIVDDGSTDDTWQRLQQVCRDRPYYRLVRHDRPQGLAAARNTGVNLSQAQAICYCDPGDRYLEAHLFMVLTALNQPLPEDQTPRCQLPHFFPAAVKTSLQCANPIQADWQRDWQPIGLLNLGVRRAAHHFIGGFAEPGDWADADTDPLAVDDLGDRAYTAGLQHFFGVVALATPTVEMRQYPDKALDSAGERPQQPSTLAPERLAQLQTQITQRHAFLEQQLAQAGDANHWFQLGNEAHHRGDWAAAIRHYYRCLTLQPNALEARYNLGVTHVDRQQWPAGIHHLHQLLEITPNHALAHNSLGMAYGKQNQLDAAIAHYHQAIALQPDLAKAHMNLGMMLLIKGDLLRGFAEFEWRWQTDQFFSLECPHPRWDGGSLAGKSLLIHTEQGAGDAIQFIRYIPLVADRADQIILVCTEVLRPVLETVPGIDKIVTPGEISNRDFDAYIPLMSLPQVLGTTLDAIPAQIPYVQSPANASGSPHNWPDLLNAKPGQLKVGVAWGGSPTQGNDRNRSARLQDFWPLLRVPGIQFYSLQKGERVAELADLPADVTLQDLDPHLHNWGDTAAAMEHLDLVISVDTGVVHLAGAMGKPVWVMLCFSPDWRWLLDRDDSPWYPTLRLFRQPRPGAWSDVVERVAAALPDFTPPSARPATPPPSPASAPIPRQIGIGWPLSLTSGWGVYGLNLALQLLQTPGYEPLLLMRSQLSLQDLNPVQQLQFASLQPQSSSNALILHALDSQFSSLMPMEEVIDWPKLGVVFREDTQITPQQSDRANAYDLILTGSSWNTNLLNSQGINGVRQVFQGIDPTLFHPGPKSNLWAGRFVIFSGGKLEYRKGQDVVIAAFRQFHQRHPEALLVTAWHNAWPQYMAGLEQTGHVVGLPQLSPQQTLLLPRWLAANGIPADAVCTLEAIPNPQMGRILREVDAAVFPNRCEGGTNLAAMECLACGVPTILSANTGHLDLISNPLEKQHCYPLKTQRAVKPVATFQGVEGWGESDVAEVVEQLEHIYTDSATARRRGQAAINFMADWTWQKQVARLLQVLQERLD